MIIRMRVEFLGGLGEILELYRRRRALNNYYGTKLYESLVLLQKRLRDSSSNTDLTSCEVISVFLQILNKSDLPEAFILIVFNIISKFIKSGNIFIEDNDPKWTIENFISEISFTITSFRYVQTEFNSDRLVDLQKLEIIRSIVESNHGQYLTDEAYWSIISNLHSDLLSEFRSDSIRMKSPTIIGVTENVLQIALTKYFPTRIKSEKRKNDPEYGLPCAMKIVAYFIKQLKPFLSQETRMSISSSEMITILTCIDVFLQANGDIKISQDMIYRNNALLNMLRDDAGKCIVLIATNKNFPNKITRLAIQLYITILKVLGPSIKITTECMFRYVFIKAIQQFRTILDDINACQSKQLTYDWDEDKLPMEQIEFIIEALADILSIDGSMETLFVSFDCDPTKLDVVAPIWKQLGVIFTKRPTTFNHQVKPALSLARQTFVQLCIYFSKRNTKNPNSLINSSSLDNLSNSNLNGERDLILSVTNHFKTLIQVKKIILEASERFAINPRHGLSYLQSKKVLETPLNSKGVAKFLRLSPVLPKENIGCFLGELGKDDPKHECEHVKFHEAVLLDYVNSFEFTGMGILDCLRIFLSAFRLPGEAQQIDRILVGFSERCHASCNESKNGMIENSEVTYLLCFSIVMLNTDRHNPNIKAERKMKKIEYVRNNKFYGSSVNQTTALPEKLLESIYDSINEIPLRTESNTDGNLTTEIWSDLQLQANIDPYQGFLHTTTEGFERINQMNINFQGLENFDFVNLETLTSEEMTYNLLCGDGLMSRIHPYLFASFMGGKAAFIDSEIYSSIWKFIFQAGFGSLESLVIDSNSEENEAEATINSTYNTVADDELDEPNFIWESINLLVMLLNVSYAYENKNLVDIIMFLFGCMTGAFGGRSPAKSIIDSIMHDISIEFADFPLPISDDIEVLVKHFTNMLSISVASRAVLCTFLQIVHNNPFYLDKSWYVVFHVTGLLRDAALLPLQLVIDNERDILAPSLRDEFESELLNELKIKEGDVEKNRSASSPRHPASVSSSSTASGRRRSTSSSSGSYLYEVFFGNSSIATNEEENDSTYLLHRWDDGYRKNDEDDGPSLAEKRENEWNDDAKDNRAVMDEGDLKYLIVRCGISSLVADSKLLDESSLMQLLTHLINITENRFISSSDDDSINSSSSSCFGNLSLDFLTEYMNNVASLSQSSTAWCENLISEITIRNRDRSSLLWPYLSAHYSRTIAYPQSKHSLNYIIERRVVGLLRVSTKVLVRKQLSDAVLTLLHTCFASSLVDRNTTSNESNSKHSVPKPLGKQIASGILSLLTNNVECLPGISLDNWQVIFDIIASVSEVGGLTAVKAFEIMAWILHEPRLQSEVPIFCIVAIRPLLSNTKVPMHVSLGAIKLLNHLHGRLEMLANLSESSVDTDVGNHHHNSGNIMNSNNDFEEDTPCLWENCLHPLLEALCDGCLDSREIVALTSVDCLATCIMDKHTELIPLRVMIPIFESLVLPTVSKAANQIFQINTVSKLMSVDTVGSDNIEKVFVRTISNVVETFIEILPRLTEKPEKFVLLWLNVLDFLGIFLGASHGISWEALTDLPDEKTIYYEKVISVAMGELRGLLTVARQSGMFNIRGKYSSSLGQDLLQSTKNKCQSLTLCPTIFSNIFEGGEHKEFVSDDEDNAVDHETNGEYENGDGTTE